MKKHVSIFQKHFTNTFQESDNKGQVGSSSDHQLLLKLLSNMSNICNCYNVLANK